MNLSARLCIPTGARIPIVGATEADPSKLYVSNESPIGAALIGARLNSVVEVETPGGLIKLKVLEITH